MWFAHLIVTLLTGGSQNRQGGDKGDRTRAQNHLFRRRRRARRLQLPIPQPEMQHHGPQVPDHLLFANRKPSAVPRLFTALPSNVAALKPGGPIFDRGPGMSSAHQPGASAAKVLLRITVKAAILKLTID